ncbi:MAG: DUF4176 domain-containing protein [Lachnospiraceae bacterium]|nr:DUF4176 domain-containing protein [Lachnospiraceae bacterium]
MNIKGLLPVGSVVVLKDGEKRLMIIGIMQTNAGGDGKEYDYLGIFYPEGYIGEEFQYMFNHEDIKEVVFRGFEDEERSKFISKLAMLYKQ